MLFIMIKPLKRALDLKTLLGKKSVLLLGPRGTGKSFLIRHELENIHYINLLKSSEYLSLNQDPSSLEDIAAFHKNKIIVIDEVQKIPVLLDETHRLIEEQGVRFLLTGSSARKLRANHANLLAGRAWIARLFPLTFLEIPDFSLKRYLQFGGLPAVALSEDPIEELDNYIQTYIEAELKTEGIIRKIPAFSRFLKTASLSNGELLNFQNIASDAQVPVNTVKEHYKILEDTMIGYSLEPWRESKKRKAITTAKFYFFDLGVLNFISGMFPESEDSPVFGNRFEHFIINEVVAAKHYQRRKYDLQYWRSTSQFEVDLIFGNTAIEIKATKKASDKFLSGLKALKEEMAQKRYILVSRDKIEKRQDGIDLMYYEKFLKRLWSGEI